MSKGSKRRPTANQRMAEANLEILHGGWSPLEEDPPGTRSYEVQRFYNNHDESVARPYWRPLVLSTSVTECWTCECGDEVTTIYKACPICEHEKEPK